MGNEASADLMARWQGGDQQAASILFERYAERLVALVRVRLSDKLARRFDAEDVVQSAYRSFFTGAREGRFALEQSGALWPLLVAITLHKLHRQVEYHTAGKRALDREGNFDSRVGLAGMEDVLAGEPSPDEAAALADEVEQMMRGLDALQRRILELRLAGYTLDEIAAETQRSQRTVRRVLDRVKEYLEQRYQVHVER